MTIESIILITSICIGILAFCIYATLVLQNIYKEIQNIYLKMISFENRYERLQNNIYNYGRDVKTIRMMVEDMAVQDSYSLKDKIKLYLREKLVVD